jgi:hypothetical protein
VLVEDAHGGGGGQPWVTCVAVAMAVAVRTSRRRGDERSGGVPKWLLMMEPNGWLVDRT